MRTTPPQPTSGHVFKVERKCGLSGTPMFRLPDGLQIQKRIGRPADSNAANAANSAP